MALFRKWDQLKWNDRGIKRVSAWRGVSTDLPLVTTWGSCKMAYEKSLKWSISNTMCTTTRILGMTTIPFYGWQVPSLPKDLHISEHETLTSWEQFHIQGTVLILKSKSTHIIFMKYFPIYIDFYSYINMKVNAKNINKYFTLILIYVLTTN